MRITNKINAALPHVNLPLPEDDPQRRNPDITLAKETLNWFEKEENMKHYNNVDSYHI